MQVNVLWGHFHLLLSWLCFIFVTFFLSLWQVEITFAPAPSLPPTPTVFRQPPDQHGALPQGVSEEM
jgi:hypothetical protein